MLGRRLTKEINDATLLKLLDKSWRIPVKKMRTTLGDQNVVKYLQEVQKYQKMTLQV